MTIAQYGLTLFKVHFGLLTLKAYTKGERVLRFKAIVHNTRALGLGRALDRFPKIVGRLATMVDRFCTALDCVDVGFLPDGILDQLPLPSQIGATRVGGIDLNKARMRSALAAVLALSASPEGFSVADLAARVHTMTAQTDYTAGRRPTTCASSGASNSSPRLIGHAATTSRPTPPAG